MSDRKKAVTKKWYSEPITSYGLILYSYDNKGEPLFLLYQRRDSFEYMDFLRGVWRNEGHLPALFANMTSSERERLREYTFDELWDDLWIIHDCKIYRDGYSRGKRKYDCIKNKIPYFLESTNCHIEEPPWGFPKGKKSNSNESNIECALREFQEETHILRKDINIENYQAISENFKGSNGRAYATHYFVASIPSIVYPDIISTPNGIRKEAVSEEASKIEWFKFEDALELLNPRRQSILQEVYKQLK